MTYTYDTYHIANNCQSIRIYCQHLYILHTAIVMLAIALIYKLLIDSQCLKHLVSNI